MKTQYIFSIISFLFLITLGCDNNKFNFEDKIIGKWEIEATGLTEEDMKSYDPYNVNEDYFEFLSDKTVWHFCATCVGEKYFQAATYDIDSKHFSWYTKGSNEPEVYYYDFYDDRLKITSVNPRYPGNLMINITNIKVYKRIK